MALNKMKYTKTKDNYLDLTVGVKPMLKNPKIAKESISSKFKKVGKSFGSFADRLEIATANIQIGSRVEITKGGYKGVKTKILKFIPGGIHVMANGDKINIRHGSYKPVR